MNVELTLTREKMLPGRAIGRLEIADVWRCWVLEDKVREIEGRPVEEWKIKGITAIPRGRYAVVLDKSARFGKVLPRLLDVPGYSGVRIHAGNTPEDTEGCLLVGQGFDAATGNVTHSRAALAELMSILVEADDDGAEIWITIT